MAPTSLPRVLAGAVLATALALPSQACAQEVPAWPRADPAAVNIDPALPERLKRELAVLPRVLAVGIVRDGKLAFEYTGRDTRPDTLINVASVTKSVLAILVGIAIDRGVFASVEQPIADFFPELQADDVDPKSRTILLKHMLSMSAGWAVDPSDMPPEVPTEALKRRIAYAPGERFQYDNASSHLLAIALARAAGMTLEAFADAHLFGPLGIRSYVWSRDAQGRTLGWHMLHLTLHDMLKIGQLVLDRGAWRGARVVSAGWIDAMLTRRNAGGPHANLPYGYLWYVHRTPDERHDAVMAIGFGGQFVYLVPALRLVVAVAHSREQRGADLRFLRETVLPAVWP